MEDGWVCLHRKIWQKVRRPIQDPEIAWIWMFSLAEFVGENRGCLFASYDDLAVSWGWSKQRVISQIRRWATEEHPPRLLKSLRTGHGQRSPKIRQTGRPGPDNSVWCFCIANYDRYQQCQVTSDKGADTVADRVFGSSDRPRTEIDQKKGLLEGSESGEKHPTQTLIIEQLEQKNKSTPHSPQRRRTAVSGAAKSKNTDPRIKELIDFFFDKHQEIKGFKYVVTGGKDGKSIQRILSTLPDVDEIKVRMVRYLNDKLSWMDRPQWTISGFASRINAYPAKTSDDSESDLIRKRRLCGL